MSAKVLLLGELRGKLPWTDARRLLLPPSQQITPFTRAISTILSVSQTLS